MPPKRKARQPGERDVAEKQPSPTTADLDDPWTDDQEALLFKSMISWKPVGMQSCSKTILMDII